MKKGHSVLGKVCALLVVAAMVGVIAFIAIDSKSVSHREHHEHEHENYEQGEIVDMSENDEQLVVPVKAEHRHGHHSVREIVVSVDRNSESVLPLAERFHSVLESDDGAQWLAAVQEDGRVLFRPPALQNDGNDDDAVELDARNVDGELVRIRVQFSAQRTYYVRNVAENADADGDDESSGGDGQKGTSWAPFTSVHDAAAAAADGDTVLLQGGSHEVRSSLALGRAQQWRGEQGARLVFQDAEHVLYLAERSQLATVHVVGGAGVRAEALQEPARLVDVQLSDGASIALVDCSGEWQLGDGVHVLDAHRLGAAALHVERPGDSFAMHVRNGATLHGRDALRVLEARGMASVVVDEHVSLRGAVHVEKLDESASVDVKAELRVDGDLGDLNGLVERGVPPVTSAGLRISQISGNVRINFRREVRLFDQAGYGIHIDEVGGTSRLVFLGSVYVVRCGNMAILVDDLSNSALIHFAGAAFHVDEVGVSRAIELHAQAQASVLFDGDVTVNNTNAALGSSIMLLHLGEGGTIELRGTASYVRCGDVTENAAIGLVLSGGSSNVEPCSLLLAGAVIDNAQGVVLLVVNGDSICDVRIENVLPAPGTALPMTIEADTLAQGTGSVVFEQCTFTNFSSNADFGLDFWATNVTIDGGDFYCSSTSSLVSLESVVVASGTLHVTLINGLDAGIPVGNLTVLGCVADTLLIEADNDGIDGADLGANSKWYADVRGNIVLSNFNVTIKANAARTDTCVDFDMASSSEWALCSNIMTTSSGNAFLVPDAGVATCTGGFQHRILVPNDTFVSQDLGSFGIDESDVNADFFCN